MRAFITSDGEVHFVKVGVFRALLAEVEDADRRRHGHLKEPAASAFQGHIPFAPPHHTRQAMTRRRIALSTSSLRGLYVRTMARAQSLRNHAVYTC